MEFEFPDKVKAIQEQLERFMEENVYPAEKVAEEQVTASGDPHHFPAVIQDLQIKAREIGLWNLFLPDEKYGAGLTNYEYTPLCEIMGRSFIAPRIFNCAAPDTGNMEILAEFGTEEQKKRWLEPLLAGEIRSCFSMVEYIVIDVGQPAPTFGGQPFDVGGTPVPVPHWSLHVWLHKDNPAGLFKPFNPTVSCPAP